MEMPERIKGIPSEAWQYLLKVLLPALVAMSVSLAVQMKSRQVKLSHVLASIIIAVGTAYITGGWVLANFSSHLSPIIISLITIISEKIVYWLIFKFNFGVLADELIDVLKKKIKKIFGK